MNKRATVMTNGFWCVQAGNGVVVCRVEAWQSWEQLADSLRYFQQVAARMETCPYLLYDFSDRINVPQPWSVPAVKTFLLDNDSPSCVTILVNAPRVLKVFMRMAEQVYEEIRDNGTQYHFVDTMDEAQSLIAASTPLTAKRANEQD